MTLMDKQPSTLLSPEGDAELKRLYADLAHASRRATAFLRTSGVTSAAFLRADREVTRIVKRIKEIRGLTRQTLDGALTTGCVAPAIAPAACGNPSRLIFREQLGRRSPGPASLDRNQCERCVGRHYSGPTLAVCRWFHSPTAVLEPAS